MSLDVKEKKNLLNVMNVEEVDMYCRAIAGDRSERTLKWFTSIFRKWLLQEPKYMKRVMRRAELDSPWLDIANEVFHSVLKVMTEGRADPPSIMKLAEKAVELRDDGELPEWALTKLKEKVAIHVVRFPGKDSPEWTKWNHWADYCETLPERDVKHTIPVMVEHVKAWDRRLAKQKLIGSLSDGVEIVKSKVFEAEDCPYILVKLKTKQSFQNEGAVMSHCVAGYHNKRETEVYSLRSVDSVKPLATIEINTRRNSTVQIQGPHNSRVKHDVQKVIDEWRNTEKIGIKPNRDQPVRARPVRDGRPQFVRMPDGTIAPAPVEADVEEFDDDEDDRDYDDEGEANEGEEVEEEDEDDEPPQPRRRHIRRIDDDDDEEDLRLPMMMTSFKELR